MILTILQAIIAIPKIGGQFIKIMDMVMKAYRVARIRKYKKGVDEGVKDIKKKKDQRKLEDVLRGN